MKWEYYWTTRDDLHVFDAIGASGWELVTVDDGMAYFKRPKEDNGEEEAVKEAQSKEDTNKPQRPSTAGQLYTRAYE